MHEPEASGGQVDALVEDVGRARVEARRRVVLM